MTKMTNDTIIDDIVAADASVFDIRFSGIDEDCEKQYRAISSGGDGWIERKDAWKLPSLEARRKAIAKAAQTIEERYTALGFEKRTFGGKTPCVVYTKASGDYVGVLSDRGIDGEYDPTFYQFEKRAFDVYLARMQDAKQAEKIKAENADRSYRTLGATLFGAAAGATSALIADQPLANVFAGGLVGALIGGVASRYGGTAIRSAPAGSVRIARGMEALLAAEREPTVKE